MRNVQGTLILRSVKKYIFYLCFSKTSEV